MTTRNRILALLSISSMLVLFVGLASCSKKCSTPDSTNEGDIVEDAVIYPLSGGISSSIPQSGFIVDENSSYADKFEVRLTSTSSRAAVNYSSYKILALPTSVICDASFTRNVEIIDSISTVRYTVSVFECSNQKCVQTRYVENYVLVPVFPSTYTVEYIELRNKL